MRFSTGIDRMDSSQIVLPLAFHLGCLKEGLILVLPLNLFFHS